MFDQTIGTLPPSARLSQLSLPTGKLSTLNNITSFLNKPVLHELKEFLFPNISRTLLDQRGFGRELLAACDARGIRVVFQEELALLRDKDRYSPISAAGYFDSALEVDVAHASESSSPTSIFRVYYSPPSAPSLRTSTPSVSTAPDPTVYNGPATAPWARQHLASGLGAGHNPTGGNGMVFVCVHGAGYSGLSFACFAKDAVAKGGGKVGALAYDARGHGKTKVEKDGDGKLDMSLEAMSDDLVRLLKEMFPVKAEAPSVVLIGHSMGGAVAVDACPKLADVVDVVGLSVLDVVEGTALDALQGMNALIAAQPKGFQTVEQGIEWHLRSKVLNNAASARLSVPPLLMPTESQVPNDPLTVVWRADLAATQPFWEGWFTGLSAKFLACRTAKLLLLAGADRLDTALMVGQMQGKYQLEVFTDVGHCVQEVG
ncbi:hypothetical protein RQP46_003721 [Phenoliferia psychrophenolica]